MTMRRVANVGLDGTTVTISFGKAEIKCIKASYGDKLDPGTLSHMGSQEIGEVTPGTYSINDFKVTMSSVRFRTEFMPAWPSEGGGGNVRLPIVVGREHPDLGSDSDLIENCRCIGIDAAVENSNKAEEVELTFKPQQIKWTDARKPINKIGSAVIGATGF